MLTRAQVEKANCARHICWSTPISGTPGTGARLFAGSPLYMVLPVLFSQVTHRCMLRRTLICKKVCPCAQRDGSKACVTASANSAPDAGTANGKSRAESVLRAGYLAQLSAQIAPRAAAACCRRSVARSAISLLSSQHGFSTDRKVLSRGYTGSSKAICPAVSTGSTHFFGLAPLRLRLLLIPAGRISQRARCDAHMRKPVLPVLMT